MRINTQVGQLIINITNFMNICITFIQHICLFNTILLNIKLKNSFTNFVSNDHGCTSCGSDWRWNWRVFLVSFSLFNRNVLFQFLYPINVFCNNNMHFVLELFPFICPIFMIFGNGCLFVFENVMIDKLAPMKLS